MQTLRNKILTIDVNEHGAELTSIRKDGIEYLWQADPAFWKRRSPVLFPIVGSVWDGKFRVDGQEYALSQHGFARDMEFVLASRTEDSVTYRLESNEQTLRKYPWPFRLEISYKLVGNEIVVGWMVRNTGDRQMFFQIGAHPAFYYPEYNKDKTDRGFLSFDRNNDLNCVRIVGKGCVDPINKHPLRIPEDGMLPLFSYTFDEIDTLMLQDSQIHHVTLHKQDRAPWISLSFDAPVVGIWSPPGRNAPFICLEPWYGRADRVAYKGEFKDRDWVNSLAPDTEFHATYRITIH